MHLLYLDLYEKEEKKKMPKDHGFAICNDEKSKYRPKIKYISSIIK